MLKKIKNFVLAGALAFALAAPIAVPTIGGVASAAIKDSVCTGAGSASGESCSSNATLEGSTDGLQNLAGRVVDIFSIIIGAIAIIMLLYGGFRYITSGGDSGKVGNAKNTLLYAIIGLIIVALAQIIVNFVLGAASQAGQEAL